MHRIWIAALTIAAFSTTSAAPAAAGSKVALTLEDIFAADTFRSTDLDNLQWQNAGAGFTFSRENPQTHLADFYLQQLATGKERRLLSGESLMWNGAPLQFSSAAWSADMRYLLLAGPSVRPWDGFMEASYFIYDMKSQSLRPLADTALRNVALSPDGKRVGYVRANNLYVADLDRLVPRAITTDGSADVFNGIFDYGSSEFGGSAAWFWSPDGRRVAFWRFDVTAVKTFHMVDELGKYNTVRALKYPNTAERHAVNRIGVHDLAGGKTTWMEIGDNPDDYIPRIDWAADSSALLIQRLTRDHKTLDLLLADAASGASRPIARQTDPAWVDITDDLRVLADGKRFIWTSEERGYRHAYLRDADGSSQALTRGDWEISSLAAVDEAGGWLYFYAKKDARIDQNVYRVRLDGTRQERLSKSAGWYEWRISPDGKHAIETRSDINTPPQVTLRRTDGAAIRVLEQSQLAALERFALPKAEFLTVNTSDGASMDAFMIKPPAFDPGKRYPVIAYGYGNAGSQVALNRWGDWGGAGRLLWHFYMAQQGYVVFAADNRTTAGHGKQAYNLTYGHYARYAVSDYLQAADYLASLPYVDSARLGFWGWSGGGYLAAALMTKGAPRFKVAVSVAPVIDLSRYQAVGVERWMGQLAENPQGYFETNLINYADRLEGKLLLVHGSGDENVKYAFTLQFADALIHAGKQFDMMIYPNQHHRLDDAQLHVYTKITNYFRDNL
jgi:dipeptidyl-peptidase 4